MGRIIMFFNDALLVFDQHFPILREGGEIDRPRSGRQQLWCRMVWYLRETVKAACASHFRIPTLNDARASLCSRGRRIGNATATSSLIPSSAGGPRSVPSSFGVCRADRRAIYPTPTVTLFPATPPCRNRLVVPRSQRNKPMVITNNNIIIATKTNFFCENQPDGLGGLLWRICFFLHTRCSHERRFPVHRCRPSTSPPPNHSNRSRRFAVVDHITMLWAKIRNATITFSRRDNNNMC